MKNPTEYEALVREGVSRLVLEPQTVKDVKILVARDRAEMGDLTSSLFLWKLAQHCDHNKIARFARAPSQVEFWGALAQKLAPGDLSDDTHVAFFDEIRGHLYRQLWEERFVAPAPDGCLANRLDINFGDGSEAHAKEEAKRLNRELLSWHEQSNVYSIAVAGLSPNEVDGHSDYHLAFHRQGQDPELPGPYFALPMSEAGSRQQAAENVVANAGAIQNDWVNSLTALDLTTRTDQLLLCLPDGRGGTLYHALHDSPEVLPAAKIQQHHRLTAEEWPSVIVVMTQGSWEEYKSEVANNS